jgi:L-lactate dehydrogenase complex protein LldG
VSSRDSILATIRANLPSPLPLPDVPYFDAGRGDDLWGRFVTAFKTMGGTVLEATPDDPMAPVRTRIADAGFVISRVSEIAGTHVLDLATDPRDLETVDVAIVRAAFGIAETGTVALTEAELGINTLGYLAQHLIVLLDPADILVNLHQAYQRPEFKTARYTVFHTGPSATADIEGVLIHGAQGVRSLSILAVPRSGVIPSF